MDTDALTKQAAEELLREAKKFMNRREAEFKATQMKRPMRTNKTFLGNTLRDVVSFNKARSQHYSPSNGKKLSPHPQQRRSAPTSAKRRLKKEKVSHQYKKPEGQAKNKEAKPPSSRQSGLELQTSVRKCDNGSN